MNERECSRIFKTLGNPTDVKILCALRGCKKCVTALELELDLKQSNLSQHLNFLKRLDILDSVRNGNKNCYFIKDKRFIELIDYVEKKFKEVSDE